VIRVDTAVASMVQDSATAAVMSGSLSMLVAANTNTSASDVQSMVLGVALATTPAPATTVAPAVVTTYIIVTPVVQLPTGAYLSTDQETQLIASYIAAFSLALDAAVTVSVSGSIVSIQRTTSTLPTANDLASKPIQISYTDSTGNTVTTFTASSPSTSQPVTNSGTSDSSILGAAVGGAVGGVILVALIVVVLVLRSRRAARKVKSDSSEGYKTTSLKSLSKTAVS